MHANMMAETDNGERDGEFEVKGKGEVKSYTSAKLLTLAYTWKT